MKVAGLETGYYWVKEFYDSVWEVYEYRSDEEMFFINDYYLKPTRIYKIGTKITPPHDEVSDEI